MMESVTIRAIFEAGEAKEARKILLMLGADQWGEPPADVKTTLEALADVDNLNEWILQIKHAAGWQQLLGPASPQKKRPPEWAIAAEMTVAREDCQNLIATSTRSRHPKIRYNGF